MIDCQGTSKTPADITFNWHPANMDWRPYSSTRRGPVGDALRDVNEEAQRLGPLIEAEDARLAEDEVELSRRRQLTFDAVIQKVEIRCASLAPWEDDRTRTWVIVEDWYRRRYGNRAFAELPTRLLVPVMLRGAVYELEVPYVFGSPRLFLPRLLKGATKELRGSLSEDELNSLRGRLRSGLANLARIEVALERPQSTGGGLFKTAWADHRRACDMAVRKDFANAVVNAQQAAEKAMKAFLRDRERGFTERDMRRLSHDLDAALTRCVQIEAGLENLRPLLGDLPSSMEARYGGVDVSAAEAVRACRASLFFVGGLAPSAE